MPNINLIHDTTPEEQRANDARRAKRPVGAQQLTSGSTPSTQKPPMFSGLRALFRPRQKSVAEVVVAPRAPIVQPKLVSTPPPAPSRPAVPATPPASPLTKQGIGGPRQTAPQQQKGGYRDVDVNLVPEDITGDTGFESKVVQLVTSVVIAAIFVGVAYVGLVLYDKQVQHKTQQNTQSIATIDAQLNTLNADKRSALVFHAATLQTLNLLNKHVYWTKFLSGLSTYTIDTVYYRSMSADQAGHVTLAATGKDFRSVSRQLLAFRAATDFASDVVITSASVRDSSENSPVDFTITLTLTNDVLYRTALGSPTYPLTPPTL